jgi:SAM-dependent methyltransferase
MRDGIVPSVGCPRCGGTPDATVAALVCPGCGARGLRRENVIDWRDAAAGAVASAGRRALWRRDMTPAENVRHIARAIGFSLDPVSAPLSPSSWLTRARLERYSARTLSDPGLARQWATHYLAGLAAPPLRVLDHGTGRGRHLGILAPLGCAVAAQDVAPDAWWQNFPRARFQIVPPDCDHLPWPDAAFDLVLDWMVIEHFATERLARLGREVARAPRAAITGGSMRSTPSAPSPRRRAWRCCGIPTKASMRRSFPS